MAITAGLVFVCLLGSAAAVAQQPSSPETPMSPKQLAIDILHDQKPIWTFPGKAVTGKHWKPILAVAAGTIGLVVTDPYTERYFHERPSFGGYKTGVLRGRNTTLAITLTPVAFYLAGLAKQSAHARNTGLLVAEGVIDTQILSFVLKNAAGRLLPSDIPPQGNLRNTWFKYQGSRTNGGSFPSGHTASAFAVATIVSGRYREHRWIPWVAYGAAAFLSLTRLPAQAHFPSDIFLGAAMGYGIGRFVVLER